MSRILRVFQSAAKPSNHSAWTMCKASFISTTIICFGKTSRATPITKDLRDAHPLQNSLPSLDNLSSGCCCCVHCLGSSDESISKRIQKSFDKSAKSCMRESMDLIYDTEVVEYFKKSATERVKKDMAQIKGKTETKNRGDNKSQLSPDQGEPNNHTKELYQKALNAVIAEYGLSAEDYNELQRLRQERHLIVHPKIGHEETILILEKWRKRTSR
ncbi:hypothetical protein BGX27_006131 [Mortierella sp. AM989]|nr:hypothetical protein BGX27_006131 [Mortierella sp. AM989]